MKTALYLIKTLAKNAACLIVGVSKILIHQII